MKSHVTYSGYRPGALAKVLKLHADYYGEHWNFGLSFEAKVASELAEFLTRKCETRDLFLSAYAPNNDLVGSISIDASRAKSVGAHLRWFIVSSETMGQGIGHTLLTHAVQHCDHRQYSQIYLTTFQGLDKARKLYDQFGFKLVSEESDDQWNGGVIEQKFVRTRPNGAES